MLGIFKVFCLAKISKYISLQKFTATLPSYTIALQSNCPLLLGMACASIVLLCGALLSGNCRSFVLILLHSYELRAYCNNTVIIALWV